MRRLIIVLSLASICWTCDRNNQKLVLINNSNDVKYYRLLTTGKLHKELFLYRMEPLDSVKPNFVMGSDGAWEYKIDHSRDSMLYIFVFEKEFLDDSIIGRGRYEMRGWKVIDLEKTNWIIKYPNDFQ
jgi:hypothetical protein